MVLEATLAVNLRHLSNDNLVRIRSLIEELGFILSLDELNEDAFFSALKRDKKVRKGDFRFVFPTDIGQTKSVAGVAREAILDVVHAVLGDVLV